MCFSLILSYPWEKIKPLYLQKLNTVLDEFNNELNMDKLESHPNVDPSTFEELKSDIIERINSFEK
jgi:restriction endonuclease Mrr